MFGVRGARASVRCLVAYQGDGHGVGVDGRHEARVLMHALWLVEEVEQAEHKRHVHESLTCRGTLGVRGEGAVS